MKVPFYDHARENESIKNNLKKAIMRVISSGEYERGRETEKFEKMLASHYDTSFAITTGSCYDALLRSILALGIGKGDEVITVSNTDIACSVAIRRAGAKVSLVDIDEEDYNIDPSKIEEAINDNTKAILVVHMYGHPAKMDEIMYIANKYELFVIEDAAIAQGARYNGRFVGTFGDVGCFSHAPSKILGNIGDGGSIITNNEVLAKRIRNLFIYKSPEGRYFEVNGAKIHRGFKYFNEGYHGRMVEMSAAILRAKLKFIDHWIEKRRNLAKKYDEMLKNTNVALPYETVGAYHVYRNYAVRVKDREYVRMELAKKGIETGMHYIPPLHMQPVYSDLNYPAGSLPVTEKTSGELFTLPIYPSLKDEVSTYVAETLVEITG
jgi:dTDP-4-amino-4,6-dideoxygalactose transaminase